CHRIPPRSTGAPLVSRPSVTIESSRPATVAGGAPTVEIALSPEPIPSTALPPDTSSTLAMALAVTTRCRVSGLVTRGPSRTREVLRAASVSVTYSSRNTDHGDRLPALVHGECRRGDSSRLEVSSGTRITVLHVVGFVHTVVFPSTPVLVEMDVGVAAMFPVHLPIAVRARATVRFEIERDRACRRAKFEGVEVPRVAIRVWFTDADAQEGIAGEDTAVGVLS